MGFVLKLAKKGLFGGIGAAVGALAGGGGKKKLPQPLTVTRDDARDAIEQEDELRRRRGRAADILTGTRGAEASLSSIGRLIVGS